jgi:hypothetical protein
LYSPEMVQVLQISNFVCAISPSMMAYALGKNLPQSPQPVNLRVCWKYRKQTQIGRHRRSWPTSDMGIIL